MLVLAHWGNSQEHILCVSAESIYPDWSAYRGRVQVTVPERRKWGTRLGLNMILRLLIPREPEVRQVTCTPALRVCTPTHLQIMFRSTSMLQLARLPDYDRPFSNQ
ncbi:uncharacterized protein [Physcomitrium patens]|uniref:uncharacterized protein n=1 Tax=Physcomitrium patens TaxID=3218 RepID=UPI003CCCCD0E